MNLYKKILEAQKAIGYVSKNGKNSFHKYDYAMEADILDTVKKAANDAGLVLVTSTTAEIGSFNSEKFDYQGNKTVEVTRWAHVTLNYKVIDAETGEKEEGTFNGYSEDKGDKAIYKATTGANKYFLMKFFGVATGDDPEKEDEKKDPQRQTASHPPAKQPEQPKAARSPQRQQPIQAGGPPPEQEQPTEEEIKKSLVAQIGNLAGIAKLTKPQLFKIIGVHPANASVDELDAGKVSLVAFNNRFLNKQLTPDDKILLGLESGELAAAS